jgi:UDP-GlcNAc:undecaprenyl-phosphate GlcNAc-1-phosphate transferase
MSITTELWLANLIALAGRPPFQADRAHFHHMLQDLGLGPRQTLLVMIMIAMLLVALGGLMQLIWPSASAGVFALVTLAYLYWVKRRGWSIAPKVDKATNTISSGS